MKPIRFCLLLVFCLAGSCSEQGPEPKTNASEAADTIFVGDNVLTMDENLADANGVAIRGEKIVAVGSRDAVMALRGPETRVVELGERALLPGFIDAHGHFTFAARFMNFINVSSPPVGRAETIDDIVRILADDIERNPVGESDWIVGYGYDDSLLAENRHPTRDDLDRVTTDHPIVLMHVSGHLAAANSKALALSGISADSDDPPGGVIRRRPDSREPNGVLEESAASRLLLERIGGIADDTLEALARKATRYYASYGITTVQDGAISPDDLERLRAAARREPFAVDIGAYVYVTLLTQEGIEDLAPDSEYNGGIRLAGVKFSLDGSPQGRTAWLTEPYAEGPPGAEPDYVAYPTMEPSYYKERVAQFIKRNVPVLVHANGDAAIDLMMDGVAAALEDGIVPDHRSVIVHAQLMREDQVERARKLRVVPSFFSAHTFFWGDWHRRSFGDARAQNISPTRWAIDKGVDFTVHNDTPIVPPDMMRLLWATVNRTTRSGHIIGPQQRLTVMEALYAMTLGGAYQYFEEDSKGSITVGKQADLVILAENPLNVEPNRLKDIAVLETFSRGRSVCCD